MVRNGWVSGGLVRGIPLFQGNLGCHFAPRFTFDEIHSLKKRLFLIFFLSWNLFKRKKMGLKDYRHSQLSELDSKAYMKGNILWLVDVLLEAELDGSLTCFEDIIRALCKFQIPRKHSARRSRWEDEIVCLRVVHEVPTEPWKIPLKKKRTGVHVRTTALNAANSLGMALDSCDYPAEFKEWNFRNDSDLSAMREFLCTASEHPGGAHVFTTNDSDWVWAVGFSLKFSKKKFTKGEKDETKLNQDKFFQPIWHKPDKSASFCNELQFYQVHFDLITEEIFALNGEFSWFACKENTIEDKLKVVVTAVFCSTSAIKKRPAMKKNWCY